MKSLYELTLKLSGHPKARDAEKRLKKAGITDTGWEELLESVALLPAEHLVLSRETWQEANRRRKKLACEMRALAKAIDADRDASRCFPAYRGSGDDMAPVIMLGGGENLQGLAQWIADCAEHLEAIGDPESRTLHMVVNTRVGNELEPYVIRGVARHMRYFLKNSNRLSIVSENRARNIETALLASAVLNKDVTAHRVVMLREKERRRYYKE